MGWYLILSISYLKLNQTSHYIRRIISRYLKRDKIRRSARADYCLQRYSGPQRGNDGKYVSQPLSWGIAENECPQSRPLHNFAKSIMEPDCRIEANLRTRTLATFTNAPTKMIEPLRTVVA
jgi:hypothetical protein